jgi:hypothetical protein
MRSVLFWHLNELSKLKQFRHHQRILLSFCKLVLNSHEKLIEGLEPKSLR